MINKIEEGEVYHYSNEGALTDHLYTPNKELPILDCIELPLMAYTIGSTSSYFWKKT